MIEDGNEFSLLDHVPLGVCVLARDYRVLFWNTCIEDWTRVPRKDIVGVGLDTFYAHFRDSKYRSRLADIFAGGPPAILSSQLHSHLFPCPLPNGRMRVLHTTVKAVPSSHDGYHALFAVEDVTELTKRLREYHEMRNKLARDMREREEALAEIKVLTGLLPICAACKRIRDDVGYWQQIETYITTHSDAEFSHSICPDCARRLYPEFCNDPLEPPSA